MELKLIPHMALLYYRLSSPYGYNTALRKHKIAYFKIEKVP